MFFAKLRQAVFDSIFFRAGQKPDRILVFCENELDIGVFAAAESEAGIFMEERNRRGTYES